MSVTRIVVLLTLKAGSNAAAYEHWVRFTDLPVVRSLKSVADFKVYQATGLLSGGSAPYDYIEILDVADDEQFQIDAATDAIKRVAGEFAGWADAIFITTREIMA